MNRQGRRELFYIFSVFKALTISRYSKEEGDKQHVSDLVKAPEAVLEDLAAEMDAGERRAAMNQVKYKTLQVVTRAAKPAPIGDEVVLSVDDINTLFYHGREECVLCDKAGKEVKRCRVRQIFKNHDLEGICEKDDLTEGL